MGSVSAGARTLSFVCLTLAAVVVLCGAAQWYLPERSVQPVAEQFLCDGRVEVNAAGDAGTLLSKVECVRGMRREDISLMSFGVLAIPCGLVIAAASVLVKRIVVPKQRTNIRRAPA